MKLLMCMAIGSLLFLLSGAMAVTAEKNLLDIHANTGNTGNNACLACHASVTKASMFNKACKQFDKTCKTFHRVHLESKLATPKKCADCHSSTDLRNGSGAALRKQVDPEICAGCHSGGIKGAKVLYSR